jgi:hypothetical protein
MLRIDHGMDDSEATSLEQVRAFLAGSGELRFGAGAAPKLMPGCG